MIEIVQRRPSAALRAYRFVNRPYYWLRPSQIAIRLRALRSASDDDGGGGEPRLARTAWGSRLYCWPDPLGLAVERTGVYDLVVAETLARLADPGETAVDAGANVGFVSNLLAHAVGRSGRVVAFEPHPQIFQTLSRNATRLRDVDGLDVLELNQAAVSTTSGMLPLGIDPATFAQNKGTASLEQAGSTESTDVRTVRLDDSLTVPVGVLKLDVEGHELAALEGAERLLREQRVRDILFEEHQPPPTAVTELLQAHGYSVFGVRQGLLGPVLCSPQQAYERQLWDPPALLATADPERAAARLKPRGWVCLRGLPRAGRG
jgi:FkbM family methyltransferase